VVFKSSKLERSDPILRDLGDQVGPIAKTNMCWHTSQNKQVGEDINNAAAVQPLSDPDRRHFAGEFIYNVQHWDLPAIMVTLLEEVVGHKLGVAAPAAAAEPSVGNPPVFNGVFE
jgi:hypothetical protein